MESKQKFSKINTVLMFIRNNRTKLTTFAYGVF